MQITITLIQVCKKSRDLNIVEFKLIPRFDHIHLFVQSANSNLKYMGLKMLKCLVDFDPKYTLEFQEEIMESFNLKSDLTLIKAVRYSIISIFIFLDCFDINYNDKRKKCKDYN